jgi:hypothetical protein
MSAIVSGREKFADLYPGYTNFADFYPGCDIGFAGDGLGGLRRELRCGTMSEIVHDQLWRLDYRHDRCCIRVRYKEMHLELITPDSPSNILISQL